MILDLTKFHAVLERIATALEAAGGAVVADVEGAKRGRGRPPKGEAAAANPEVGAASAQSAANAAGASTQQNAQTATSAGSDLPAVETAPTLQKVADAIIDLANTVSRDKAVEILGKYGAKKVPELKPETFAAVLKDVAAAKAPATAGAGLI